MGRGTRHTTLGFVFEVGQVLAIQGEVEGHGPFSKLRLRTESHQPSKTPEIKGVEMRRMNPLRSFATLKISTFDQMPDPEGSEIRSAGFSSFRKNVSDGQRCRCPKGTYTKGDSVPHDLEVSVEEAQLQGLWERIGEKRRNHTKEKGEETTQKKWRRVGNAERETKVSIKNDSSYQRDRKGGREGKRGKEAEGEMQGGM